MVFLKAAAGVALLWWLAQKTNVGSAAIATVKGCPAGTISGPWFTCIPNCDTTNGEFVAYTASGAPYCAHHGTITDPTGNPAGTGDFDPSVGANGSTTSLPGLWTETPTDGPVTSIHDPRLG